MLLQILSAVLLVAPAAGVRGDTTSDAPLTRASVVTSLPVSTMDSRSVDTVRRRRVAVEYSDWYARRLALHRWASYTTLPLFAAQYVTGQKLMDMGSAAPLWVRRAHGPLATGVTALFTVNTVTGLWNLRDSRNDPAGRGPRIAHSLLLLASDAGFTAVGLLATPAQNSSNLRQLHKTIALTSMGAALLGYAIMLPPFRRD